MSYALFEELLICPECGSSVNKHASGFICGTCQSHYPVYFGIPVMISPGNPLFSHADFAINQPPDIFFKQYRHPFVRFMSGLRPDVTLNLASKKNYRCMGMQLSKKAGCRILIIGGSIDGVGMQELKKHLPPDVVLVESDVAHGPNTNIILDSHRIPFASDAFDLVIVQAVLEHVLDPFICVSEIRRVLKPGGIIYSETPFMQQVHGGRYDFHRFTDLGHRRLFRNFEEIERGVVAGAGSSLAWSLRYFMLSFARNKTIDRIISYGSSFFVFWLKYFDYLAKKTHGTYDGACGLYFWGTKKEGYTLSDNELVSQYRGFRSI